MPSICLYHPDFGWGPVVRRSADGRLLVNFPNAQGIWVDPCSPGVTLEGAAKLTKLKRPGFQWGYCWNCNRLAPLRLVVTCNRSGEGYECPHCQAVSKVPHATCRDFGAGCDLHPQVDPDGDPVRP